MVDREEREKTDQGKKGMKKPHNPGIVSSYSEYVEELNPDDFE